MERYRALMRSHSDRLPARPEPVHVRSRNGRSAVRRDKTTSFKNFFGSSIGGSHHVSHTDEKRMANVGPEGDTASSGYDADIGSDGQFSTLSRDQRINRRRWFAHYDCESLAFEFIPINRLLHSDTKRSVIASGASAAIFTSALASEVGSEDELRKLQGTIKVDRGDGNSNLLVKSCPQFRNEIGGAQTTPIASIRPEVTQRGSHIPSVDGGKSGMKNSRILIGGENIFFSVIIRGSPQTTIWISYRSTKSGTGLL